MKRPARGNHAAGHKAEKGLDMAQPQIDILTTEGEAPLDSKRGYELFKQQCAKLNQAQSAHELKIANRFNALNETEQQIWLKAAGCPLLTDSLAMGGERVTLWRQLSRQQRTRMMKTHRSMRVIARGDV